MPLNSIYTIVLGCVMVFCLSCMSFRIVDREGSLICKSCARFLLIDFLNC
jgi:hypothetical protein